MSADLDHLLAAAADDTDRPLHTSVDDIVHRGRRAARRRRLATIGTAALTVVATGTGITAWSGAQQTDTPVAAGSSSTVPFVAGPPPVSTMTDAELISRCAPADKKFRQKLLQMWSDIGSRKVPRPEVERGGPLDGSWTVALKAGTTHVLAIFVSADQKVAASCRLKDGVATEATRGPAPARLGTPRPTTKRSLKPTFIPLHVNDAYRVPANVTSVRVRIDGETVDREALIGKFGYFTIGVGDGDDPNVPEIVGGVLRATDKAGKLIYKDYYSVADLPAPIAQVSPMTPQSKSSR